MTLLADSGNSRLHIAWWDDGTLQQPAAFEYPADAESLRELLHSFIEGRSPDRAAACSVNATWRAPLFNALETIAPGRFHAARTSSGLGVRVRYDDPDTMGIDRVLAGYAAWRMYREPVVVVDFGTAVTVDAVGIGSEMLGGYIIPGFPLMAGALADHTSLPPVTDAGASDTPGDSTEACIRNGITGMIQGGVRRLIEQAAGHAGAARIIVTGGGEAAFDFPLALPVEHRPFLVLEGLGLALDTGMVPLYRPVDVE